MGKYYVYRCAELVDGFGGSSERRGVGEDGGFIMIMIRRGPNREACGILLAQYRHV